MTQLPEEPPAAPEPPPDAFSTGAVYGVLFIFGIVLGAIGGFAHAWYIGVAPVGAIASLIVLTGALLGTGRLMRARLGALVPALGWLVISMLLSLETSAGDLVIAGNLAGYVYLYGGAVMVVVAVLKTRSPWLAPDRGPELTPERGPELTPESGRDNNPVSSPEIRSADAPEGRGKIPESDS